MRLCRWGLVKAKIEKLKKKSWLTEIRYLTHITCPCSSCGEIRKTNILKYFQYFLFQCWNMDTTWHDTQPIIAEGKTGNVFIENKILAPYFEFQIQPELIITTVANWVRIRKRYKCLLLYINIKTLPVSAKYFYFKIFLKIFCYVEICLFL